MKIQIDDNSIRIGLTQPDLEEFSREGYVEHTVALVSNSITYALESRMDELGHELSADLRNNVVTIYVPQQMVEDLTSPMISAFNTYMDVDFGEKVFISIEKDFSYKNQNIDRQLISSEMN